jgi:hypothetical protein
MSGQMEDLAHSMFTRNALHYTDETSAEAVWMLEDDVRVFWVNEAIAVMNTLGLDPNG